MNLKKRLLSSLIIMRSARYNKGRDADLSEAKEWPEPLLANL